MYIIAEAGVNHNGDTSLALRLVEIAAQAGADAVKFQTFRAESLVNETAEKASYQRESTGDGSQFDMLKKLEMSPQLHIDLIKHCKKHNIDFMSTAFDEESLDFLLEHGLERIKVPSGEITNVPLLQFIASKNIPIILSTGMSSLSEIASAKKVIEEERRKLGYEQHINKILTILHCTSNYPAKYEDVNLRAMLTIQKTFDVPIGYSDHTLGIAVSTAAVGLGACVIEKHFTLSRDLEGPDHKASLEPGELESLVLSIRAVELSMGSDIKEPTQSELPIRSLVRRSATLAKDVKRGDIVASTDLILKRPGHGIQPNELNEVVGKPYNSDLTSGTTLTWQDIKK